MENEHQMPVDALPDMALDSITKKLNNPKSALSYSEIIQLRQNKQGSSSSSGGGGSETTESGKYFCNNCNRNNHVYNNCRAPITSIGVIAFRCGESGPEFLMIRRRDSFGFVDFVRGKYSL